MNLAENLKKIRKEHNLSQEQLAEQLGVSRQSVSKWESNQAYPEMDKVIQLAKMFNLNVDDLLNQDIREVNREKQSKITINKYVDDFLSFITKTVDMFSSMKWNTRLKCIFEQFIIGIVLLLLFSIIGAIGNHILSGLISVFPYQVENMISRICDSIYLVFASILAVILFIHIFKVRYLDYYVIVKEDKNTKEENNESEITKRNTEPEKIVLEKKKEKIVIRDPKHSEYRFISGMLKCLLFLIKGFALMIAFPCSMSLVFFVVALVISFLIMKTGLFFLGVFLATVSCIFINIIILVVLFNFIMNRKNKKKFLLVSFIVSLILFGVGVGIGTIGFTSFDYINDMNHEVYLKEEIIIPMQENLVIESHNGNMIEYIEEDRNDIRIVSKHTKNYKLKYDKEYTDYLWLHFENNDSNILELLREILQDINHKKIINYSKCKIYIYTSKNNIEKLNRNQVSYFQEMLENDNAYN